MSMSYRNVGKIRVVLLGIMLCVSLSGLVSCRWRSSSASSIDAETDTTSVSPGIHMTASIISDRERTEKLFKSFLPDSGIVPIEVTVRNLTDIPVMIHTSHGLEASEPFHGFILEAGGEKYSPIAPLDALAILMGEGKTIRYSKPGVFQAVVGIALPPAILVYGHREMSIGRRYRSLFKHSIYKATDGGAIVPIRLDPDGEAKGVLFFYPSRDANPFVTGEDGITIVDSALVDKFVLTLRPGDLPACDTLRGTEGWSGAAVAYFADPSVDEPAGRGERDGIIFALPTAGKWRGGGLLVGRIHDVLERGETAMTGISDGLSSKARIVGTAALGDHALCAVNFKASSRMYLVDISGPPALLEEIELNRKIRRAFLTDDGIVVATRDDRCRYISLEGMKQRRNVKTGKHIRDIFLDGDRLVLLGKEELSIYGVAPSDPLRLIERRPFGKADRRFIGVESDIVYMVHESGNAGRDTLAAYEKGSLEEIARMILPASAGFTDVCDEDLILQLDGGALLRIVFDRKEREFETEVIGHLPFGVALVERNNGYTVLGEDGTLAPDGILPHLLRDYITAVPVGVKAPGTSSSRTRARH